MRRVESSLGCVTLENFSVIHRGMRGGGWTETSDAQTPELEAYLGSHYPVVVFKARKRRHH